MKRSVLSWIERQLASYSLASDTLRMVIAAVVASATRIVLWFILIDLTSWMPEESSTRSVTLFVTYFFFCVYYFLLCQYAFDRLNPEELRTSLQNTKSAESNPFLKFISGESGTSHATMFSIVALIGVGVIAFRPGESIDQSQETILQVSALLAVLGSWISNAASFALQYARDDAESGEPGFQFPDGTDPVWSDYLYSAIMVSATLSTADINVVSRSRRTLVAVNTIIAFTFNTVIIAMLIAAIM